MADDKKHQGNTSSLQQTSAKDSGGVHPQGKPFLGIAIHSFFVIPFLIALSCILLFSGVRILTQNQRSAYDFLEDVKVGGLTKRWQSAFELSKILANPRLIPQDEQFFSQLSDAFEHARHDDNRTRQYLALAMGRTGRMEFVKPLLEGLKEEKEENLTALIYALGMLKQKEAAPALYPYLDHPQPRIRSIAVVALGNIAHPDSAALLTKALEDPEPNVQWGAAVSLARLGDAGGREILGEMLDREYWSRFPQVDDKEQNDLILMAIEASGSLRDSRLDEKIIYLGKNDPNAKIRFAALEVHK